MPKDTTKIYRVEGPTVIQDAEIEKFKGEVSRLIDSTPGIGLAMDFSNTYQISSRALGLLVAFHKRLKEANGQMVLFGVNPAIKKVIEVTHVDTIIPSTKDEQSAVDMLEGGLMASP